MVYRDFRKLRKEIYEYLNLFGDSIRGYKEDVVFVNSGRQVNKILSLLVMDAEAIFDMKLYCEGISVKFQWHYCDNYDKIKMRKFIKIKKRKNGYRLKVKYGAPEKEIHNVMFICFLLLQLFGYNNAEEKRIGVSRESVCWMILYYWSRLAEREYVEYLNRRFMQIVDRQKFEEITEQLGDAMQDLPIAFFEQ